jgi:hypothetical protein
MRPVIDSDCEWFSLGFSMAYDALSLNSRMTQSRIFIRNHINHTIFQNYEMIQGRLLRIVMFIPSGCYFPVHRISGRKSSQSEFMAGKSGWDIVICQLSIPIQKSSDHIGREILVLSQKRKIVGGMCCSRKSSDATRSWNLCGVSRSERSDELRPGRCPADHVTISPSAYPGTSVDRFLTLCLFRTHQR